MPVTTQVTINFHIRRELRIGTLLIVLILSSCTTVTTTTPDGRETTRSLEDFEDYVESVFRRQNKATLDSGQLLDEEINPQDCLTLEQAEHKMLSACSALNQVVKHKMEQSDSGILLELEVKNTIGDCDFAARELEQLIEAQD